MNRAVSAFLAKHNFIRHVDIDSVIDALLYDMNSGLHGQKVYQDMIRTYSNPPENPVSDKSVIVIDAGGTNFRSCLVSFNEQGKASIDFLEKTKMPGVAKTLSRADFFDEIAAIDKLDEMLERADVVASVLPSNASTEGMWNEARFSRMKRTAFFLNAGRGSAVNSDDLYAALANSAPDDYWKKNAAFVLSDTFNH